LEVRRVVADGQARRGPGAFEFPEFAGDDVIDVLRNTEFAGKCGQSLVEFRHSSSSWLFAFDTGPVIFVPVSLALDPPAGDGTPTVRAAW
jgi:hypothetical protein